MSLAISVSVDCSCTLYEYNLLTKLATFKICSFSEGFLKTVPILYIQSVISSQKASDTPQNYKCHVA